MNIGRIDYATLPLDTFDLLLGRWEATTPDEARGPVRTKQARRFTPAGWPTKARGNESYAACNRCTCVPAIWISQIKPIRPVR
jgi:hypothetical protein